jgi:L-ascorbate metabolism protein UlaG (beta-lactamase superfamily)
MMQGDQYRIPVYLNHEDGSAVTEEEVRDVEIFVGSVRKALDNGIIYDEGEKCFYVNLTQKETFRLSGDVRVQARILFTSGDVVGVNLGTVNFETSVSKVVLQ